MTFRVCAEIYLGFLRCRRVRAFLSRYRDRRLSAYFPCHVGQYTAARLEIISFPRVHQNREARSAPVAKRAEATSIFIRLVNGRIRESVNVWPRAMASFRYTPYIPQFIRARSPDYDGPGVSKRVGSIISRRSLADTEESAGNFATERQRPRHETKRDRAEGLGVSCIGTMSCR